MQSLSSVHDRCGISENIPIVALWRSPQSIKTRACTMNMMQCDSADREIDGAILRIASGSIKTP